VGVAIVLLFALEVTFVAVMPTGRSALLSPSNPSRRNTATPHEAIFIFPLIDWCTFWLKFSQTKIKATDIGCFFRLHVRPDLGTSLIKIRSLSWHSTSRTLVG
jgi:hypothetical protein